ncbi:MAG: YfiR family protein [Gammaproteobacteria bacterium]
MAKRGLRALSAAWLVLSALPLWGGGDLSAQTAPAREYQVKAVFLFHFAQFVDWPPHAFPDARAPLVIGVLGEDPFGAYMDETVRDEKAHNRPLVVQRYRGVEDIETCHVLFISRSMADRSEQILTDLNGKNILTVGDTEGFALRGVMIRFIISENKIRFRINLEAAKAADLTISSKLLRPAEIVTTGKN